VHEVAQKIAPESKVMYVDIDPVAVAHSKQILADNPRADVVQADLREPAKILYHPEVVALLDFSQPVAVLLNAVLHFVSDEDDPAGILAQIRETLVGGSYVTVSHGVPITERIEEQDGLTQLYRNTPTSVQLRTTEQIAAMLDGFELVEPGIAVATKWRPDAEEADDPPQPGVVGAVARKP
jgi:hypothetical protein